jgi:protein-L-isoaspartate(D-aspartate) O-methyltransferase
MAEVNEYRARRRSMVEHHLERRGIRDRKVLDAMGKVPREAFVPAHLRYLAYDDGPLPIGEGQTISQPYIVAFMTEALLLEGGERVLEIGTGSGYAAAVLGEIAGQVVTVERIEPLAETARTVLESLGYSNVTVIVGDGTKGCAERAPYDAIVVTAGGPRVPQSLKDQLAPGGRLVMPVGDHDLAQRLVRVTRRDDGEFDDQDLTLVRFVPLIGEEGWHAGMGVSPVDRSRRQTPKY